MDPVFEEEQAHLSSTYEKLLELEAKLTNSLEENLARALDDKENIFDELTRDLSSDIQLESLAELEAMNRIIDSYNLTAEIGQEELRRIQILLDKPYFAKIKLKRPNTDKTRTIYLGTTGASDEMHNQLVVDWRSPVAEVYYNQDNGRTSYRVDSRTIEVDLELRRQFDIERNKLRAYFDTTVAIEDPLLLASLNKRRSARLTAITTTIQKEQNQVIRHEDVPALLVHGIAGSGKTSVLLQRIAYLFYTERENLKPENVYLLTPNPVFGRYIDNVLPDMGESNPHILSWYAFMREIDLEGRGIAKDGSLETLRTIDESIPSFELQPGDYGDIKAGDERVIKASSVRASMEKYSYLELGPRRCALAIEDLLEKLEQRIRRLSKDEDVQDELTFMPTDEQLETFGQQVTPIGEDEIVDRTREWLEIRYAGVRKSIEAGDWLRIDRIGMRMLGKQTIDASEWLYLKLAFIGCGERHARYVMIDEVQDYSLPQLAVLARYFSNAHFLLLGDENQAVREGTATFSEIRELFQGTHGRVDECALMISYRSSPEITDLFCKLLPPEQQVEASSVQRPGIEPLIVECESEEGFARALQDAVKTAASEECLTALIANSKTRAKQLAKMLEGSAVQTVGEDGELPESGVVLLDVKLAKGLEFDHVIVPDVQEGAFPNEAVRRHRLYTALSRATKRATLVANGPLTHLLK